ncbi:hypothetical protein LUZ62_039358 [Rhynchospora pubera]|uniref:TF-B3 domain-containing protein n=1 Tax=Rhynchospora pubera TaxID=906938 RepID=A0AAV8FB08_9POAL|nr:hypothetical protein LUZ62_039358 [Rhynchospora pubera]
MDFSCMHFYKHMGGFFMHSIILPEKLTRQLAHLAGKVLELKRPSGGTWHVGLIMSGEKLVLQPGWNDFASANRISQNDHLVFKFIGESKFEVFIFDPTGCEKGGNFEKDEQGQDGSLGSIVEQKYKAKQLTCKVQANNPYFLTILKKYNLTSPCRLRFPADFSADHLPKENLEVILCCPDQGKTWFVTSYFYLSRNEQTLRGSTLEKFMKENELQEGDLCVFELFKNAKRLTFEVHVSRATSMPES